MSVCARATRSSAFAITSASSSLGCRAKCSRMSRRWTGVVSRSGQGFLGDQRPGQPLVRGIGPLVHQAEPGHLVHQPADPVPAEDHTLGDFPHAQAPLAPRASPSTGASARAGGG